MTPDPKLRNYFFLKFPRSDFVFSGMVDPGKWKMEKKIVGKLGDLWVSQMYTAGVISFLLASWPRELWWVIPALCQPTISSAVALSFTG